MAGLICPSCQTPNEEDESFCETCGHLLTDGEAQQPTPKAPEPAADTCPACGAVIPEPTNLVCVDCLEPLTPGQSPPPAALRLTFNNHPVEVPTAGSVLLGRDPDQSPVAELFAPHDNISRRHASVGVEKDGRAWVRDENSTNGTFVNNKKAPSTHKTPLLHGDQLRMGSDVTAQVELTTRT